MLEYENNIHNNSLYLQLLINKKLRKIYFLDKLIS
jgi:hypothetical protein